MQYAADDNKGFNAKVTKVGQGPVEDQLQHEEVTAEILNKNAGAHVIDIRESPKQKL